MTKERLIRDVYERVKDRGVDFEAFRRAMAEWDLIEYPGAIVIRKYACFHIVATNPKRWASRHIANETLGDAIKKYGYAETAVMNDHADGHRFVQRLGFKEVSKDESATYYRLEESCFVNI